MLFSRSIHRWVRRFARAVLPAPRPRVSCDARRLAKQYATAPADAQRLIDALGVDPAEVSLQIARHFGLDVRSIAERVRS